MGKGNRKRRDPVTESTGDEKEIERQTEEKAQLVPPARRPPTAVGAETPPPPPREPARPVRSPLPQRDPPTRGPERRGLLLPKLIHEVQVAGGALLELADAAAGLRQAQMHDRSEMR